MFQVADWSERKLEIASAFRQAMALPTETDEAAYREILAQTGIRTSQDMKILTAFVNDVIMEARREERPTTPLSAFLDWLKNAQMFG